MVRGSNRKRQDELTPQMLLKAYSIGLFPMAESADDPNLFWVEPEMRGVIPLDGFHAARSLRRTMRRGTFEIRRDTCFDAVMRKCAEPAPDRPSTWINETILSLYGQLHTMGHAHSVEAFYEGELVGGLYGVSLRGAFFGESMFSRMPDASKVCLLHLVDHLNDKGFKLLDTQFTTEHLKRFGAVDIPKNDYELVLINAMQHDAEF